MFTVLETESTEDRPEGRKGERESMKKGRPIYLKSTHTTKSTFSIIYDMFIHVMTSCSFTEKQIVGKQSLAAASTCIPQKKTIIFCWRFTTYLTWNGAEMSWQCSYSFNLRYWGEPLGNRNLLMQLIFF